MSPANALALYGLRLRARLWQEGLAVVGIAAGVALLFASQVASSSLQSSVAQLSRGIAGNADVQLQARDPHGLPQGMVARVRALPGVAVAAPVLEASANAVGPRGSRAVELVGVAPSLSRLGGTLVRGGVPRPFAGIGAVALSAPVSSATGLTRFGQEAIFQLAGRTTEAPLYTQPRLHSSGPMATGALAVAPLAFAQEMTGLRDRVSRILVRSQPGSAVNVVAGLRKLAGDRLNVEPIDREAKLFANAATASNQSSALFAAISALVGFLFAFNAMLFTVPQRRRLVVDLRREGYGPATVASLLLLDAVALGFLACALGLALGEELSIHVLHSNPAFLSLAFSLGSGRDVGWHAIAVAVGGGMLAAIVAVLSPLRGLLSRDPLAPFAPRERSVSRRGVLWAALAGLACLSAATAILLATADAAIPGMVLLVAALLLVLPGALELVLTIVEHLARTRRGAIAHVAVMELRAAGPRAIAIAATGAIAIFGSVAIQGAHDDLLAGLEGAADDTTAFTDAWVAPAGSYDLMDTLPFAPGARTKLARLPGVRAVLPYRSGLIDIGARRVLVLAPSPRAIPVLPARQLVQGDAANASERLHRGGWLVVSRTLAAERHLHVGGRFVLPSPHPSAFRVAALSTNLGWAPGAIVMNSSDYTRAWGSADIGAYNLLFARGAGPAQVVREIEQALGPRSGLAVQTAAEHAARQSALSRQALSRLAQIATVIPILAVLAMIAAIGAMVWQRRPRLARLQLEGFARLDLWCTILLESVLLLGAGCLCGAIFGLYGQRLADRALAGAIDFPVVYSITAFTALSNLVLMMAAALLVIAVPGYLAASAPATLALQD
ncbi:MAG TPA: ABC transporter permease [Solirubrobacteraceae bacterium]|nr:ABC transporter permease [Solirubrobacteraceae bacterium]